ncbi:DUF6607 family protein [Leeuwenhoekiella marinoflava]|uniref:DUF6607 family protein n=1 Tax=Leeuwenhoekiella marinoflava TaxID=988 RepID=UPI00300195E4
MNNRLLATTLTLLTASTTFAQSTKKEDRQAIKDMCGCFEIEFKYAETFSDQEAYQKHDDYYATALEWATLIEDDKDKLAIQHLLIVQDTMVIKHWRQDWEFENTRLFTYQANKSWTLEDLDKKDVKGQWTQKVYQVDDSPRYSGSATWVHVDGKDEWQNTTPAPLPRREYTKRHDYNIMLRNNQVQLTDYGWLHEQDNIKISQEADGSATTIAEEKGFNSYKRVPDSRCEAAQKWWVENQEIWKKVRAEWDVLLADNDQIKLKNKVADKRLYEYLFELKPDTESSEIKKILKQFME